jgi:uncharacterized protein YbjT (DUF2867 family)
MTIVINTPNGKIGRRTAERLLDSGVTVRIVSRSPGKVTDLTSRGASLVIGSTDDEHTLAKAFDGAETVFWVTPPAYRPDYATWVRETTDKAASAMASAKIERLVNISSIGAQAGPGTGPIAFLGEVERIFNESIPNVVHLRPGSFMENHLADVASIASEGKLYSSLPKNAPMAKISTSDIGDVATTYMLGSRWAGQKVHELHGPRDLTPSDSVELIAEGIDQPVALVEITIEQAKERMLAAGIPDFVVSLYTEMFAAMREGRIVPEQPRTPKTTTPTGLRRFATDVLKPAIDAAERG